MKRLLLALLSLFSLLNHAGAQTKTWYDREWKTIDSLVDKVGRPATALTRANAVYTAARGQGNEPQLIRAIYYRGVLRSQNREDNAALSIRELEQETSGLRGAAAAVAHSLKAELYYNYLLRNIWSLRERTTVANDTSADLMTWSLNRLLQSIDRELEAALASKTVLQQVPTETWSPLLRRGNAPWLRPTLYDLVAFRALDIYANTNLNEARPERDYALTAPWVFDPAPVFIRSVADSGTHPVLKRLRLLQDITRFHLTRNDAALEDFTDETRLEFAYAEFDGPDKDSLYVRALRQRIAGETATRPAGGARLALASWYHDRANSYVAGRDSTWRYAHIKALELIQPMAGDSARYPHYYAMSVNLQRDINGSVLDLRLERVNLPAQPFRYLVKWRNLSRIYLRVIAIADTARIEYLDEDEWAELFQKPVLTSWEQTLPATTDKQAHSAEGKVPALPTGRYLLLASSDATFRTEQTFATAATFYVSNLAYLQNGDEFFVVHRDSGRPVSGAQVRLYEQQYNSAANGYLRTLVGTYVTKAEGRVRASFPTERYGNYQLDIRAGTDRLNMTDENTSYYSPRRRVVASARRPTVYFFTDRGLYRPGQTAYLKGIVLESKGSPELLRNAAAEVILRDANYKEQGRVTVQTNEFGSFQAKFALPAGGLGGRFTVSSSDWDGMASFSVEEYKRPKFEVRFDTLRATYRVGDTVTMAGSALAYAGNSIEGAQVRYRVIRTPQIPYFYRWWYPASTPVEITNGTTLTDASGRFSIKFAARPDPNYDSASNALFSFQVITDITDLNGETRSANESIHAGYTSLFLQVPLAERLPADSFRAIPVRLTNANGEAQQRKVEVRIHSIQPNQRLLRDRFWEAPDQYLMPRDSFLHFFPNDPYADEGNPATWPRTGTVLTWTDSLRNGQLMLPGGSRLPAGFYELELLTSDSAGRVVRLQQRVELLAGDKLNRPVYFAAALDKNSAQPGETVTALLQSSADLYLLRQLQRRSADSIAQSVDGLNARAGITTQGISIKEEDRGGLQVAYHTIRDNRIYTVVLPVAVPWSNKQLQVSLATFRDKTLPGSQEQWRVTVRGPKGEQVAAELLAGMYDASLDQLAPFEWAPPAVWQISYFSRGFTSDGGFRVVQSMSADRSPDMLNVPYPIADAFLFTDRPYPALPPRVRRDGRKGDARKRMSAPVATAANAEAALQGKASGIAIADANYSVADTTVAAEEPAAATSGPVNPRKNFNETAFFYPQLRTDSSGGISFSFTLPEALTRWKFQALAHTPDAAFGSATASVVTQKDLMVQPNFPRFLRQGDRLEVVAKIVNITDKELTGQMQLELFDAATGTPVDGWFQNIFPNQYFTVGAHSSEAVAFPIQVPYLYNSALTWRITARAGSFSDGEEATLPVLSSKILVTETMPLPMRGSGTKTFTFDKLLRSGSSETLQQHRFTLEYTANPAWYAVQALPYLIEYPYECAEQTWNRYYANALAAHILQRAPRIRAIFERWQQLDTAALMSNLQKNPELKSALLEETPWVLDAENETKQKKNIALLFDLSKLAAGQQRAIEKLMLLQRTDGSFPWFDGGPSDRFTTHYIVSGIGHLEELGVNVSALKALRDRAIVWGDAELRRDYDLLRKSKTNLAKVVPSSLQLLHLYGRSFTRIRPGDAARAAFDYYIGRLEKSWLPLSRRGQGLAALALHRFGSRKTPQDILQSLRETAVRSEEMGMYWKNVSFGRSWYWQDAPIETQALLIEAFAEIGKDDATVNELRTWLVKNKQTNGWPTTTGTADACYALLLRGADWLSNTPRVVLQAGPLQVSSDTAAEAGTGYFRKVVPGPMVKPEMGRITVQVQGDSAHAGAPSLGAAYWQYFEEMDKVTSAATPLSIERSIFRETMTAKGPQLEKVSAPDAFRVGDKVRVRIVLRSDRPMEYVHLKDLRPSCLEPTDVLSGYRWQDGAGYYQSTRDLSTNFFLHYLPRGTFVFEYTLFVTHKGEFSAGLASIQCMYAPEFSAHSEGQKISVE
ncbi:MAG: alpha-2-macroglobulin [Chitinophagaceae bacterium]|nr:MAG: alpha-2-macroglobulin [Chitinophagaceae bacterium]